MELKHIVGYLPYGLNMVIVNENEDRKGEKVKLNGIYTQKDKLIYNTDNSELYGWELKPILRPLSDLTKEIEVNGEKFVPVKKLGYNLSWIGWNEYIKNINQQPYGDIQKLYEWNFDIHLLIEKGEAIDINTLKQ